ACVVGRDDFRHGQVALIALAEIDRVLRAAVLLDRTGVCGLTGCGVHVRGRGLAINHDGGSALATTDLGETVSYFLVCNRILSLARRTGNLHNQPRGCAFLYLGETVRKLCAIGSRSASLINGYAPVQFSVSAAAERATLLSFLLKIARPHAGDPGCSTR